MEKWLTPEDVSVVLQVSRATAYKVVDEYIKSGGKHWRPTKRITRIDPVELKKFLESK